MSKHFQLFTPPGETPRRGVITTPHGQIMTPAFGPDATRGVIKHLSPEEITHLSGTLTQGETLSAEHLREQNELQFLLTNTFHLRSYPGDEYIRQMGGIHQFMQWNRPVLTDSGGFQVFSLIHNSANLKGSVDNDGAHFTNPRDGAPLILTPENAIDIQWNLGSDIMVVLDDCRHYQDEAELVASVERTIAWAERCKQRFEQHLAKRGLGWESTVRPLLFCVVQGGIDKTLRKHCAEALIQIGFDGYGFGGWAITEKEFFPDEVMQFVAKLLPADAPRYAMGVGTPDDMLRCMQYGYDLFDCVLPTRNARHGVCYSSDGVVRITNAKYKHDTSVLDKIITSRAAHYPRYYLHHLFKIKDSLGGRLLSIHNLAYYNALMKQPFG
ncbi:MAG: tRNA guanosine(34) transglycosylase Tgt [Pseudomonadales bacterium]|nr:tRNA guanosine(34) transglycosylase Tgt [Pseudomonadales bacterium]